MKHFSDSYVVVENSDSYRLLVRGVDEQLYAAVPLGGSPDSVTDDIRRFEQVKTLRHPNILPFVECVLDECLIAIVPYCQGGMITFADTTLDRMSIMRQLCQAIFYLHQEKKTMHLQLSPRSVRVKDGTVLIQMSYGQEQPQRDIYAAPETQRGAYGYQTDIWVLGLLFLKLLFAKHTYSNSSHQVKDLIQQCEKGLLTNLITRMLSSQMNARPTIREVLSFFKQMTISSRNPQSIVTDLTRRLNDFWYCRLSETAFGKHVSQHLAVVKQQADEGSPQAMLVLGSYIETSREVDNLTEAEMWFRRALKLGQTRCYLNLYLISKDLSKPDLSLLREGVAVGDIRCCQELGKRLLFGLDGIFDANEAEQLLNKMPSDYPKGKFYLAQLVSRNNRYSANYTLKGQQLVREGASMGSRCSIESLGDLLYKRGMRREGLKIALIAASMPGKCMGPVHQLYNSTGIYFERLYYHLTANMWFRQGVRAGSTASKQNLMKSLRF